MQLGRIIRDQGRATQQALSFLEARTEVIEESSGVLGWHDGPTITELDAYLGETLGTITLAQDNYLGAPYILHPNRRSATLKLHRQLNRASLVAIVLRCWGAIGPLDAEAPDLAQSLIDVAEHGGTYPIPQAMAASLLVARPKLRSEPGAIIQAIREVGYDYLWAIGFAAVT